MLKSLIVATSIISVSSQGQCTLARSESSCNSLPSNCHWCKLPKTQFCAPSSMACPSTTFNAKNSIEIAPNVFMPYVNMGGVDSSPSNETEWLILGGRGIDTALTYGDDVQHKVAKAIKTSTVPRSEIFLTTKVPCCPLSDSRHCTSKEFNGSVASDIAKDVAILGNVDLMLLHWPCDTYEQTLNAYLDLEKALTSGVTRAIGVSNFNASLLERLSKDVTVQPAVNQCGHSIGAHNSSHNPMIGGTDLTVEYCAKNGISYSAYSPLGGLNGLDIYKNPTVVAIASKHGVDPSQVALKWLVQQKITVVTAANNAAYEKEDGDLWSFELSENEMKTLAAL